MKQFCGNNSDKVIIGAGLAGLSAAYHLKDGYILFEKELEAGGMARSIYKDGYTFDYDGHLLHFRNEYTFRLVSELLNGNIAPHKRSSWIYSKGAFTRYPFQANFYGLPKDVVKDCLLGLLNAKLPLTYPSPVTGACPPKPWRRRKGKGEGRLDANGNFENWILKTFGEGIAQHFMLPYNRKFWTVEPKDLTCEWLDGFVPVPNLEDTVIGAISDNTKMYGYNSRFWYPVKGGISGIANAFSEKIKNIYLGKKIVTIDQYRRKIIFEDATIKRFKDLVSTIPLPELFSKLVNLPEKIKEAFSMLKWTSIFVVNLGIKGDVSLEKHWVYYPEKDIIFYRIGFPTNFSMDVAPSNMASIYVELSYSGQKKIDKDKVVPMVIEDLKKVGIVSSERDIEIYLPIDIKYGYVIYDSNRKSAVNAIKDYLERFGIYSIGRYGSWRYMSMEDVILEGKELAEKLVSGK